MLEAGHTKKHKDLSDFKQGQIVTARQLGQNISETLLGVPGLWLEKVLRTYRKWSKEGEPVNQRQGHGHPRLIDARGEQRLARVVRSHRRAPRKT